MTQRWSVFVFGALAALHAGAPRAQSIEVLHDVELPWTKVCSTPVRDPESVSLVRLLADPEKFEGKPVVVMGYYHRGNHPFHGYSALFLHKEDYEHALTPNSLWIEAPGSTKFDDGYAVITGIFTTKVNGDLGVWDAGLCNVTELRAWTSEDASMYGPD